MPVEASQRTVFKRGGLTIRAEEEEKRSALETSSLCIYGVSPSEAD